ncbi:MFS general substrate transporter [Rhizophagus irregularis]|uniref:Autophagy-related protein n=4 Tax=Rhizophagus irregularis TaxID=588596 RepID=A0A2I1EMK9_9GLOM|nr:hypothetical protein GLOIN_2v1756533 [Rhizophagus irregularis DAOM 181602=DAOM 197198]PKB99077.1 MFS general substrate transporter [Rhizophagus irregularis]PKC66120.1 MFS general substrate transporter [Rhizophagus irregularis]PKY23371.1 MFS general substrate transporter [Rhizophagus irregularis]POG64696.1 hypothetical protein GLOIN_2v1756533 [Rhizophagus irregularis DAOM 181602=DAOM 197198]UZO20181.1 hypothetical protein OCT59_011437 [Rhizophagus irregularis]|eukprot:XP_025171562.1 hypothetical protein GLOIN_2v1756533 [Rhizophagus irregularis DAOM 181602=DAOM 197198]
MTSHNPANEEEEELTTRELRAWYITFAGTEPYIVAVLSVFIPVILETYSSQAGFKLEDRNVPCDITIEDYKCVTKFGMWYVDSTSYSFYIIAVSVLAQCLVYIGCGSLADFGNNRKKMLLGFAYAGAFFTIGYILVLNPNMYWLAGLLAILSNVCFGASSVFFLACIPSYAHVHPDVLQVKRDGGTEKEIHDIEEKISNQLSVMTLFWGIPSGIFILAICSVITIFMEDKMLSLKIGCVISGIWCIALLTFPVLWMKNRSGFPLPKNQSYFTLSFKRVGRTIKSARELIEIVKYLIAWFILSDGFGTVRTVGTIFAKKVLKLSQIELLLVSITVPLSAVFGAYGFLRIQRYFNLSTKKMVIITTSLLCLAPAYALCGFIAPFGFKHPWEIWLFAVYYGGLLGATQSFCTVLFSSLIPKGHENEFFSLNQITDKGSSWLGPLITGIISDVTHDLRNSFWYLFFSILIPVLIILTVNVDKGRKDAELFAENEKILLENQINNQDYNENEEEKEKIV